VSDPGAAVSVVIWGLGAMGSGIASALLAKEGVRIVGAIDVDPRKVGRDMGAALSPPRPGTGIVVTDIPTALLKDVRPHVCVIATSSFLADVLPQVKAAVGAGANVITIAEEMAFPQAVNKGASAEIDRRAREAGVSVLGTGINPGFVLDTLIIALTGACTEVTGIRARRVNDLSPFGPTVLKTQGVGTTPEEFQRGVDAGTIVGHVGFAQSLSMIARAVGWGLDRIDEVKEPIVSQTRRQTPFIEIEPGQVAGCDHSARGYIGDDEVITLEHPQQIQPEAEGKETGDFVTVEGTPGVRMAIQPEIAGGIGTMALAVNMIPAVVAAQPGLLTMDMLPVPRSIMGDFRGLVFGGSQGGGEGVRGDVK